MTRVILAKDLMEIVSERFLFARRKVPKLENVVAVFCCHYGWHAIGVVYEEVDQLAVIEDECVVQGAEVMYLTRGGILEAFPELGSVLN